MSVIVAALLATKFHIEVDIENVKRQYYFTADPAKMGLSELIRGLPTFKKINGKPSKITIKIK